MAVFYNDTFTGANGTSLQAHVSESGHGYAANEAGSPNSAVIVNNSVVTNTNGATYARVTGVSAPAPSYIFDFTIERFTLLGNDLAGVIAIDGTNWEQSLWAFWSSAANGGAGGWLTSSWTTPRQEPGTLGAGLHLMRARIDPGRIRLFELVVGVETLRVDSDDLVADDKPPGAITTLGFYIRSNASATTGVHINDASAFTPDVGSSRLLSRYYRGA